VSDEQNDNTTDTNDPRCDEDAEFCEWNEPDTEWRMPWHRGSRAYVTDDVAGRGEVLWLVGKLCKERRDTRWIAVDNNRRLRVLDMRSRDKIRGRAAAGVQYTQFNGLNRMERDHADRGAKRLQDRECGTQGRRRGGNAGGESRLKRTWNSVRNVFLSAGGAGASAHMFGTFGFSCFLGWRAWVYLGMTDVVYGLKQRVDTAVETLEGIDDYRTWILEGFEDGIFDVYFAGLLVLLCMYVFRKAISILIFGEGELTPPGSGNVPNSPRDSGKDASDSEGEEVSTSRVNRTEQNQVNARLLENLSTVAKRLERLEKEPTDDAKCDDDTTRIQLGADRLLARLTQQQRMIDQDSAKGVKFESGKDGLRGRRRYDSGPRIEDITEDTDVEDTELKNEIGRLKRETRDPRSQVLLALSAYREKVPWVMPGKIKTRFAGLVLPKLYKGGKTGFDNVCLWADKKGIRSHPAVKNMLIMVKAVDSSVMSLSADQGAELINSATLEILLRRIWGTMKAFAAVSKEDDWKQPKNSQKWVSLVNWSILEEIDALHEDEDMALDSAEKEIAASLREKLMLERSFKASQSALTDELI